MLAMLSIRPIYLLGIIKAARNSAFQDPSTFNADVINSATQ
jgi:hypothetical protein